MFLDNLQFLMDKNEWSKHELARQSGVPYSTIVSFWKVGCDNVKLSTLRALADCFNVTLDFLINGNPTVVTPHEAMVIDAYRNHPELQDAIDKMLDVYIRRLPKEMVTLEDNADEEQKENAPL